MEQNLMIEKPIKDENNKTNALPNVICLPGVKEEELAVDKALADTLKPNGNVGEDDGVKTQNMAKSDDGLDKEKQKEIELLLPEDKKSGEDDSAQGGLKTQTANETVPNDKMPDKDKVDDKKDETKDDKKTENPPVKEDSKKEEPNKKEEKKDDKKKDDKKGEEVKISDVIKEFVSAGMKFGGVVLLVVAMLGLIGGPTGLFVVIGLLSVFATDSIIDFVQTGYTKWVKPAYNAIKNWAKGVDALIDVRREQKIARYNEEAKIIMDSLKKNDEGTVKSGVVANDEKQNPSDDMKPAMNSNVKLVKTDNKKLSKKIELPKLGNMKNKLLSKKKKLKGLKVQNKNNMNDKNNLTA